MDITPDRRVFQAGGLLQFFWLTLPIFLITVLDFFMWESMTLASGILGVDDQSSQVILLNMTIMAYMVSYGILSTSCTVIGNSIGSGDVWLAKSYFKILLVFTFAMVSLEAYLINAYGYLLIKFFTSIVEIEVIANQMIPLLIINVFPEAMYGCLSGVLRGLGR